MHMYLKKCWYCGSSNLEPREYGVQCNDCGATWTKLNRPGHDVMTVGADPVIPTGYEARGISSSPSAIVLRQAQKARQSRLDPRD